MVSGGIDMSNKETWGIFLMFLEMNDALGSYKYYVKKDVDFKGMSSLRNYSPQDYIIDTFYWRDTRQGYDYWDSLSIKWLEVLIELEDA